MMNQFHTSLDVMTQWLKVARDWSLPTVAEFLPEAISAMRYLYVLAKAAMLRCPARSKCRVRRLMRVWINEFVTHGLAAVYMWSLCW